MNWIDLIKKYKPCNEQEEADKQLIIKYYEMPQNILTRDNEVIHITSSALVVNKNKDKVLMIHHNIYNSWAWTGGHADGEADLLHVALKEVREETGVTNLIPLTNDIVSIDILPVFGHIKKGKYVSSHLHASIAYLIQADDMEKLIVKPDENSGVKWIPIDELDSYSNEPHMKYVYNKVIAKL